MKDLSKKKVEKRKIKKPKKPSGRPTLYTDDMPKRLIDFFDREITVKKQKEIIGKFGPEIIEVEEACELPTFEAFARKTKVNVDTLKEWRDKHPIFSAAYKTAKELQKNILIQNGIQGRYQTAFSIFTMKNCTDWRDKVEQKIDHTSAGEQIKFYIPSNGRD